MNSTRVRQPSSSVVTAAIFDWKPWQLRQLSNRVCLPRASGRSCRPCKIGQIAPAHRRALQRKVMRRGAVGRERDAALGLGLGAERAHAQAIVARRQVLHRVAAGIVGEHAHGHLELAVARLHERGAQRRAVRPGHRAGYAGGIGGARRTATSDRRRDGTNETNDAAMDATKPARTIDRAAALMANDRMAFPRVGFV